MHSSTRVLRILLIAAVLAVVILLPAGSRPAAGQSSSCTTDADCPQGLLCCLDCGYAGCDTRACLQPIHGHCPLFP